MPIGERDYMRQPERPVREPDTEWYDEPVPAGPDSWDRWIARLLPIVFILAIVYPGLLGIILGLWLTVYLLTCFARWITPRD